MNMRYFDLFSSAACFCAISIGFMSTPVAAQTEALDIYSAFDKQDTKETLVPSRGADADGETVADAIIGALAFNPQIAIAQSRQKAAEADKFRAFGSFLPEIEASATYASDDLRSSTLQTLQDQDGTTVGITASQPVFQGLTTINRFREARERLSEAENLFQSARHQTALEAARTHAGVILAREIVNHRLENVKLVNKQLEITEKRMKAGAQSRTGVEQARMRRAQAQVDLGQARATLAASEAAYQRVTGRQPPVEFARDERPVLIDFTTVDEAQSMAIAANPSLGAAESAVEAARHAKSAAKGAFSPKVSIEGTYFKRLGQDALVATDDEEYQVVARMRMPIFAQGRNIAGLKSSSASVSESHAQMLNTQHALEETVARTWRQVSDARVRKIAAASAIEAATQSVKGLKIEYEAGRRTVIDVLDGQRDLILARISLSQADHDYRISQYELATATGLILGLAGETPN